MHIRRFDLSDAEAVLALNTEALAGTGAIPTDPDWDRDLRDITAAYLQAGDFLVGERDGRLVAMGGIILHPDRIAEAKRLRVVPAMQGEGLGRVLLQALEERAVSLGAKTIVAETTSLQASARRLYESAGYSIADRFDVPGFVVIRYRKILDLPL